MLYGNDGCHSLPYIFPAQVWIIFFKQVMSACIIINDKRQPSFKSRFMFAAFIRMDIVCIRLNIVDKTIVILNSNLYINLLFLTVSIKWFVQHFLVTVNKFIE